MCIYVDMKYIFFDEEYDGHSTGSYVASCFFVLSVYQNHRKITEHWHVHRTYNQR